MGCAFAGEEKSRRSRFSTVDGRKRSTKVVDVLVEKVEIISEDITEEQVSYCTQILKKHQLFSTLSSQQLRAIGSGMIHARGDKGGYVFHQGQTGHSFFLVEKGGVRVEIDGKEAAILRQGHSFGELALLFRAKRSASIRCLEEDTSFFVMKPMMYRQVLKQMRESDYSRNKEVVERIGLFQSLTNKQKYNLANSIKLARYRANDTIFHLGDVSTGIYIVSEGLVELRLKGKQPLRIGELEMFGESALRDEGRRQGEARCIEDTICMVIGRKDIERALGTNVINLLYFNIQKWALLRSQVFANYSHNDINKIIMASSCIHMQDGQKIDGTAFRGLVLSLENGVNNKPEGAIFNMKQWKKGQDQCENLVKTGAGHISYIPFEKLNVIVDSINNKARLFRASQKCIEERDDHVSLEDFQVIRKLGEGQFGQVFLVKNTGTGGGLYALKCLSKKAVRDDEMEQSVVEEKRVLGKAIFPFIVGFVKAFHDETNIFLLMEYLRGKEMFDVIREMPSLSKPIARYFFGCILLSIEYLHANNIIYRDVKPENSVIDHRGKAYLIDLGTAKELNSKSLYKTFTIIGTPHYMAPEVFEGKGYSFQADYWSLGVLLYEFVCSKLPFGENILNDPYRLYKLISKAKLEYPKFVQDDKAKKLIGFILTRDPKQRSEQVTFEKIKRHQYFEGFKWDDLLEQKVLPPYIPREFRSGATEKLDSTGAPFLKTLYQGQTRGKVEEWNEQF